MVKGFLSTPKLGPWQWLHWWGIAALDVVLVLMGVVQYYLSPITEPYPFGWIVELLGFRDSPQAMGVATFLTIGLTPTAALLLLAFSMADTFLVARLSTAIPLLLGVFCMTVGLGFLLTLMLYTIRAPDVLNWDRELLAAAVHTLIAYRGRSLVTRAAPNYSPPVIRLAFATSALWLVVVAIPQHPWLVIWMP